VNPRQLFEQQLRDLEQDLLRLGSLAETMMRRAIQALMEGDLQLADEVIASDAEPDALDLEIESRCIHLLAQQQPMSKDLRVIGSILKAISDLERIADFAVAICRATKGMGDHPPTRFLSRIPPMADQVCEMLRVTMRAFVDRDLQAVQSVGTTLDDRVDHYYHQLFTDLLPAMQREPETVVPGAYLLLIGHYLERSADHCTNVAERVHYMETGRLKELAGNRHF
jgi:phosphate transport system protein